MNNGVFVISLDYEMMWGAIFNEKVKSGYLYRTKYIEESVNELLLLLKRYHIHATWASVGLIACTGKDEALIMADHNVKDPYSDLRLSDFIKSIDDNDYYRYFSPDSLLKISDTEGQEIATHTFSHFYLKEHKNALEVIESEIQKSKNVLEQLTGLTVKTLIMPKNQVSKNLRIYMKKCSISIIRGVQVSARFNKRTKLFKLLHFMDAYLPVCGDSCYELSEIKDGDIYNVRASAFWRTYYSKLWFLEPLKLVRIKHQLKKAALSGKVFHLWFHPHNLSQNYKRNLKEFEKILKYYQKLSKKYGMLSCNMSDCVELYFKENDNG